MSPMAESMDGHATSGLEPIAICGMSCRLPGGIDSDSSFWRMIVEKRSGQTPKVPKSRFNIDAHYHESPDRPGSFNVAGGYFLDGRPEDFDPTFFNITPIEAQWLDPQQRKMLEVSYECLVSAGVTLESISGSNTAVFVGSFTSDYQQMSIRDPDFRHNYAATGVDPGIISNRIGNTFNLQGPSFTINTACSSSVYALHNACHALRSRDCDAAIVGGVNLILTVDQHMNTAKLGILSPTSICHTFDESADGYGRAEGAGALYVKRLSDAIRDGDPVRGVVRSTAVNTNGKVDGMGITHPSAAGQERVVRSAYEKAELDPSQTAYAELHGTGTPVGDPIEVRAVSRAMNDTRSNDRPLLVGAVKPNIGHSEAASGIFAVIKASIMTEAALIPGIAYYKKLNPSILETEWNVKIHADTAPWPNDAAVRRASVSSFGYGGTNGHVIIESIENLYPWYQHAESKAEAPYDRSSKKPFLLCFSAHDKTTLSRNVDAIRRVAANYYFTDLAHTLNLRRTMFSHRAFTVAYEGQETEVFASNSLRSGSVSTKATQICFLFTGQGAQWVGMGKVALEEFPIFRETIEKLDQALDNIYPQPSFRIAKLLSGSDESAGNRINDAEISQPLCTAVQIALVDLFQSWDIVPSVSIGHSSGEIGAAYAAGLISAPEAIMAAFCRGRAVALNSTSGSMLAVGLGVEDTQVLLPAASEDACIACENSPTSVTVSGTAKSISQLQDALGAKGVFVRELNTGKAYHSPHMARVGEAYDVLLADALCKLSEDDLLWRQSRSQMISSVTGEPVEADYLPLNYWSSNLRQRVLFNTAVQRLGADDRWRHVSHVVEIGPHSALSGPFKQICKANGFTKFTYVPSMVRKRHDALQLLSVAGSLFLAGYGVDLEEVNATSPDTTLRKSSARNLLVDLPPYQWNYEKRHWAEPRGSAEQRARLYPRHDLLGSRVSGLTSFTQIWRNVLRHRDIPWLKDHNLGGTAIFPAAGHLSIAIEALRQVHETDGETVKGVTLRDVNIKTALVIPDNNDGVETILRLQTRTGKAHWHFFAVESLIDGVWTVHCEGRISAVHEPFISARTPVVESALSQRVSGERWYSAFDRVGFYYGKTFRQLLSTRTDRSVHHATGDVNIVDNSGVMQGESRYLVHPTTIDACLHLIIISVHAGKHKEMPWGVVPTRIEEVTLFPAEQNAASVGHAVAWTDDHDIREFNTNVQLKGADGITLLGIKNLTCVTYDAAVPASTLEGITGPEPFSVVSWKPDLGSLTSESFGRACPSASGSDSRLVEIVELITHRQHIRKVLIYGSPGYETIETVLTALPQTMTVTLAFDGEQELHLSAAASARTLVKTLPDATDNLVQATNGPHDLVILDYRDHESRSLADNLVPLVQDEGWLIGFMNQYTQTPTKSLNLGQHFALLKSESHMGHATLRNGAITILSLHGSSNIKSSILAASVENMVQVKSLEHFSTEQDLRVVIDDTANTLYSAICSDAKIFEALQRILTSGIRTLWLTQGVRQGQSASAGMAEGLLRTIRSEQAAARIGLLDVDHGEMPQDVGSAIIEKLETADIKASGRDTEFWLHEGVLHVPRVYPHHGLNRTDNQNEERLLPPNSSLKPEILDNQLVLRPCDRPTRLLDDEVEVQIQASEIQQSVSGTQLLVCGNIIRVGSTVDKTLVGSRIVTFSYDGLKTIMCTSAYTVVDGDDDRSPEALISTLLPLYPVVNLCLFRNKMAENDCLVSLPGPRSYVAMITRMAKAMGWKLKVVVHSCEEKQDCILQYGLAPDQVLLSSHVETIISVVHEQCRNSHFGTVNIIAHEFSPLAEEIWRCVPAFCRFMIMANSHAVAPDPLPFGRGAAFIPAHLKALRTSPKSVAGLLKLSIQVLKAYPGVSLLETKSSTRILDVADAGDSLIHSEQCNDTAIVRFGYGESQVKITHTSSQINFAADATYLLIGCLGGLGRSLARWMSERGAKHFAFISRSGAAKPEAAQLIERLKNSGATTQVYSADASDQDAVRRVVLDLQARGKVRGVVHAATTFKDGMFEQMDHQSFADCAKAKAQSALSLHHAVRDMDLDFFVMTSSISALLGNTGQSNYSAANSVLDALATQRRASHLPATSLVLPMVLDVGVVAENEALERSLARKGLYGIDEAEMLRGFELAMTHSSWHEKADSQLVMGFDARELARSANSTDKVDAYWRQDARFCHTRAAMAGDEGQAGRGGSDDFAATVQEAAREDLEAAITVISRYIAKRMSEILMIPVENLELDGPSLGSYGLDSMIGVEMRTWIFKEFGLDYPFQKLLAPTLTFRGLARVVAEKMELAAGSQLALGNIRVFVPEVPETNSLATLVGATDTVVRGVRKLLALKNAPQSLQQLNVELTDFRMVIATVEDSYRQQERLQDAPSCNRELVGRVIHRAKDAVLALEEIIAYGLLKIPDHKNLNIDHKVWLRTERKVRELRKCLRQTKVDILVALEIDEMWATKQIGMSSCANPRSSRQWRMKLHCSLMQLQVINDRMASTIISMTQPPQVHQEQLNLGNKLATADELPLPGVASLKQTARTEVTKARILTTQFKVPSRFSCGSFCPCACHKEKYLRSPSFLDKTFGSLFVGFNSVPFLSKSCDHRGCQYSAVSRVNVAYMFPTWFLEWIVTMKMRSPGLDVQIKAVRVRPNDSEIFSAVYGFDISRVREVLADGHASILDVNEEGESLLTMALTSGVQSSATALGEFLATLVGFGVDMYQQDTRLMSAYLYFWKPILLKHDYWSHHKYVFGSELQIEYFSFTALHAAILGFDADGSSPETAISLTHRHGIDEVDHWGSSALYWACAQGDLGKIESVLRKSADPNLADREGRTPLHILAQSANMEAVEVLFQSGADPNARNRRGGTPLHDFTFLDTCTSRILAFFVHYNANLDACDGGGWTPLHWAVRHGNIETISNFHRHGAQLEIKSDMGATPLTYALSRHQYGAFQHLLSIGADTLVKSQKGSLLHFVARDADLETIRHLQQLPVRNMNTSTRDDDGFTALERAERRRDGVVEYTDIRAIESRPLLHSTIWFNAFLSWIKDLDHKANNIPDVLPHREFGPRIHSPKEPQDILSAMTASEDAAATDDSNLEVFVDAVGCLSSAPSYSLAAAGAPVH